MHDLKRTVFELLLRREGTIRVVVQPIEGEEETKLPLGIDEYPVVVEYDTRQHPALDARGIKSTSVFGLACYTFVPWSAVYAITMEKVFHAQWPPPGDVPEPEMPSKSKRHLRLV